MTYNLQPTTYNRILIILLVVSCWSFVSVSQVSAQTPKPTEYTLLAPLPLSSETKTCTGEAGEVCKTDASSYIEGIFTLTIGIATVLAVLMIIFGGIKYMSTDAFSGKDEAKNIINNALWGLGLALSAWLILNTISPNLVNFNFNIPAQQIPTTPAGGAAGTNGILPGYTLTQSQVSQDALIEQGFRQNNPPVTIHNDPCVTGGTKGCTNVVGLPQNAINGVKSLATNCQSTSGSNCNVMITGGTEGGHQAHGPNISVVDLDKNLSLDNYIKKSGSTVSLDTCSRLGPQYLLNGSIYVDEGTHWHVCYW